MKHYLRLLFLTISMLSGGYIFYKYVTIGFDFLSLFLCIVFVMCSGASLFIPAKFKIKYVHIGFNSLLILIACLTLTLGSIFIVDKLRNLSPVRYSATFYWEEGVDVAFRKNGTFRAVNHHIFGGSVSYGKYRQEGSLIILEDKLKFGKSNMNDRLILTNEGILFTMEKPWRISEGTMSYVKSPDVFD